MSELGEILRGARLKQHLTLPDVAEATRINVQFLEALEEGEYSLLPGPAYVTGFLRNYAGFLGLHPDDIVQEFYSSQPMAVPSVKAATRVLASGHDRQDRRRVLWALTVVIAMFAGGYAIKLYSDTSAHAQPQLNVTPANLGGSTATHHTTKHLAANVRVRLEAMAPVWVEVSADGKPVFNGMMRGVTSARTFVGLRHVYVTTYDGARVRVTLNGRMIGFMAAKPRLTVQMGTRTGWQKVF